MHRVVQEPLFGGLELGDVGQRADQANDFAVGADHGTRAQREPQIMAVGGAHAEVLREAPAALLDNAVEGGAEAIAVERMQDFEPVRGGAVERSALEPEHHFGFRAGEDAIGGDVPVPDHVAGAGQRQRAALDVGHDALRHAAGERVLHDGKADQHHDQDEAAEQSRADNVIGDQADHRNRCTEHPGDQQQPGRDQHHRAVEPMRREIDHEAEAKHGDEKQRYAGDAGSDLRRKQRHRHERAEKGEPADGDVRVTHMPAVEIEIGEQEYQKRRGENRFARSAPDALGARRHVEHLAPESEIDADINQHRPAERGGGGEHDAAFDHEQDGQEQRQQSGNADDDAVIERQRIDFVLEGIRLPQIKLRQIRAAQFGDERDHRSRIERDAKNVGGRIVQAFRRIAGRRRDVDDARETEIGPDQSGPDHPVMRSHDQPVDLLIAIVGEREHRPVGSGFASADFDAADNAVGAGRGRNLHAVAVGALKLDGIGEVDGGGVDTDIDGLDCSRAGNAEPSRKRKGRERRGSAKKCQKTTPSSRRMSRPENREFPHFTT